MYLKYKSKISNKVEDIDKKKRTYYFFNDFINIKSFDPNIGYLAIEGSRYVKIYSVNPLYLIFNKGNGHFKEINGNKYSTLVSTNESK